MFLIFVGVVQLMSLNLYICVFGGYFSINLLKAADLLMLMYTGFRVESCLRSCIPNIINLSLTNKLSFIFLFLLFFFFFFCLIRIPIKILSERNIAGIPSNFLLRERKFFFATVIFFSTKKFF